MELVLATLSLVVIAVVYIRYRYNKSLYETQESIDDKTYLTKDKK